MKYEDIILNNNITIYAIGIDGRIRNYDSFMNSDFVSDCAWICYTQYKDASDKLIKVNAKHLIALEMDDKNIHAWLYDDGIYTFIGENFGVDNIYTENYHYYKMTDEELHLFKVMVLI